jgi:DNA-binding HxlR family transcriptional regulator
MHLEETWLRRGAYDQKTPAYPEVAANTRCPLTAAIRAIGGKWDLICLYWLASGTRRFNELRHLMPNISHKVLTTTLRNLEQEGLISRKVFADSSPGGVPDHKSWESVCLILESVRTWGVTSI